MIKRKCENDKQKILGIFERDAQGFKKSNKPIKQFIADDETICIKMAQAYPQYAKLIWEWIRK